MSIQHNGASADVMHREQPRVTSFCPNRNPLRPGPHARDAHAGTAAAVERRHHSIILARLLALVRVYFKHRFEDYDWKPEYKHGNSSVLQQLSFTRPVPRISSRVPGTLSTLIRVPCISSLPCGAAASSFSRVERSRAIAAAALPVQRFIVIGQFKQHRGKSALARSCRLVAYRPAARLDFNGVRDILRSLPSIIVNQFLEHRQLPDFESAPDLARDGADINRVITTSTENETTFSPESPRSNTGNMQRCLCALACTLQ